MHNFQVGDTVWIKSNQHEHQQYAKDQFGGYTGPFVIREIGIPFRKPVAKLNKPDGSEFTSGAFLERLRPDVFMCAVSKAVKSAT